MKNLIAIVLLLTVTGCATVKKSESPAVTESTSTEKEIYRGAATKNFDLIHTRLEVSFDWENRLLIGTAEITVKPHFYPNDKLYLNAQSMQIKEVYLLEGTTQTELANRYKNDSLEITLDRLYRATDTATVKINYIAQPELVSKSGSNAITESKGLYFINHDGADPYKPRQIWTQGETQASSVWFPTIDFPNQKTTQEIYITVDTNFVTLSNGSLVSSITNDANGTRTDYWRQDLPHAPYLFMMAIGEYAVIHDSWRGKDVSYYVEPKYTPYARNIFGNTPEMMEFFSKVLGVDYVWDKYAQVVVRDFVSGAMENTTATVFGDFMQQNARSQLDYETEDVVSHELFHHWFGDLVTCESWANIPLNESFATYGEYMWNQYKYGRDHADFYGGQDLRYYLKESKTKQVDLIRFNYENQEDMYDRHSYQKGGRILHMLRKYVGDDAFYASLNLYLNTHIYGTAEAHDLRLAFEKVTGEDLNWFFNEWFFGKGHPVLNITHSYDAATGEAVVRVQQTQDRKKTNLFTLPVDIDVYGSEGVERYRVVVDQADQTFRCKSKGKFYFANFDAEKMLLCEKEEVKSENEWALQYRYAPLYFDRLEALNGIAAPENADDLRASTLKSAFRDRSPDIRKAAVKRSPELLKADPQFLKAVLPDLALNDPYSKVRAEAITQAGTLIAGPSDIDEMMVKALNDSSYQVMGTAGVFLMVREPELGTRSLKKFEKSTDEGNLQLLAEIYAGFGSDEQYDYMLGYINAMKGENHYQAIQQFGAYLMRCHNEKALQGVAVLEQMAGTEPSWTNRLVAALSLESIANDYSEKKAGEVIGEGAAAKAESERSSTFTTKVRAKAAEAYKRVKAAETNEDLIKIYNDRSK